jgi:Lambda phage tail tube protein, TTP
MPSTSSLGPAYAVEGLLLQVAPDSTSTSFITIANVTDVTLPLAATTVDVTNVGDTWRRRITTLLDMGKITCKIFWMMTDPSHENVAGGLRYIFVNRILAAFQFVYPDGLDSTDAFDAYVSGFNITGKVGGVFEATVEFSNSGAPTLV